VDFLNKRDNGGEQGLERCEKNRGTECPRMKGLTSSQYCEVLSVVVMLPRGWAAARTPL
jgi:hypothetical protein